MSYAVYKYVYDNQIIYIGKTNYNLAQRIYRHTKEPKFIPYLDESIIYYSKCQNPAHTAILETYLINKYKPVLNVSMKYSDELIMNIDEPEWELYSCKKIRVKKLKNKKCDKWDFWIRLQCHKLHSIQEQMLNCNNISLKQKLRIEQESIMRKIYQELSKNNQFRKNRFKHYNTIYEDIKARRKDF